MWHHHNHRRDELIEELIRQAIRYLKEQNRILRRHIRSASITKRGVNDMAANIQIAVGEKPTLQARFFDGPPDADGNSTGAEVTPTVATLWSSTDTTSLANPQSTGLETATTEGLAAASNVGVVITDPTSGFTFTQMADVTGGVVTPVIQSASITKV